MVVRLNTLLDAKPHLLCESRFCCVCIALFLFDSDVVPPGLLAGEARVIGAVVMAEFRR